jgi:serine/threonine-protein kinase
VARPTGRSGATERASTSSANDAEDAAPARGPFIDVRRVATSLAAVLLLMVAGFIALRALDDRDAGEGEGVTESPAPGTAGRGVGLVRVVARPWAEVYVDGELADTTPIGRPLRVSPGRHFITFRHPSAPDEQRSIKVAGGQSVFLDVTMRIDRGDAGALRDAGEPAASP